MARTERKRDQPRLMGVAEIARLLRVSRQRVDQLVRLDGQFPTPAAELEAGRIWLADDIEEWARAHGRIP